MLTKNTDDLLLRLDFRDPDPEIIDISPEGGVVSSLKESQINCLVTDKVCTAVGFVASFLTSRTGCLPVLLPDAIPDHSSNSSVFATTFFVFFRLEGATSVPATLFGRPTIVSWSARKVSGVCCNQYERHVLSPAMIPSTTGLLPDVMYLADTPRAINGCASKAFNSSFNAVVLALRVFPCFLEGSPCSSSSELSPRT